MISDCTPSAVMISHIVSIELNEIFLCNWASWVVYCMSMKNHNRSTKCVFVLRMVYGIRETFPLQHIEILASLNLVLANRTFSFLSAIQVIATTTSTFLLNTHTRQYVWKRWSRSRGRSPPGQRCFTEGCHCRSWISKVVQQMELRGCWNQRYLFDVRSKNTQHWREQESNTVF